MSHIRSAIVYKAEIPVDTETLNNHLAEKPFTPPLQLQASSAGFTPVVGAELSEGLVATFPKGLAFSVRFDEKVIPGSVVRDQHLKAIADFEEQHGRKPGKVVRRELKDQVMVELLKVALVRTKAVITCFYHTEKKYLVIATTSKKLADQCVSLLIQAVGSVKTETIHVSHVKHGLTTRLKHWIRQEAGEDFEPAEGEKVGFAPFTPTSNVVLKSSAEKRKTAINTSDLTLSSEGILEAIQKGSEVQSLGLATQNLSFRITDDFHFKGIEHQLLDDPDDEDSVTWEAQAAIEMANFCSAIDAMIEMFSYDEPKQAEEAEAA